MPATDYSLWLIYHQPRGDLALVDIQLLTFAAWHRTLAALGKLIRQRILHKTTKVVRVTLPAESDLYYSARRTHRLPETWLRISNLTVDSTAAEARNRTDSYRLRLQPVS